MGKNHVLVAIIEEKNVYMFKVDEAVLVYQGVRDKTTKRRIMSRSHKNVSMNQYLLWSSLGLD